jgi:hypothetical protein
MKLQDLETSSFTKSKKVFESYFEKKISLDTITQEQALSMLSKVRASISEHRNSSKLHTSEKSPSYLKALFLEQALEAKLSERMPPPPGIVQQVDMSSPQAKVAIQKARKGQILTPDEQAIMNTIAKTTLPAEGKKSTSKGKKVMESEVQQAQVVLAAQDMVDRVQGMIEDITEMEYKDLPALVESIRNEVGTSEAQSYREQATTSLEGLVEALQNAKVQLESAQGVLTGQEPIVPGEGEMDVDVEVDGDAADVDVDVEEPAEEPRSDLEASLGRARR